ncbi:MAG: SpoIIE family protein phosphatase [Gammaproteobacteria bacterium]|nr:SpoIIE family protein phosphatase [Gammaproteobacteria bacterium]MBU1979326.1 SpoIIE family protein phosphatase [Gammaproteobacteria bacterium]
MDKPLNILVVDDTEPNLVLISTFITRLGHTTILARNGQEAVDSYRESSPDMVLMDVMMPVMDGYQATAEIRKLAGNKWVPVIFLSAKAQDSDLVRGLQVGGDDYLTKPINLPILQAKIKAMQRIAEMQREITEKAEQLERYHAENEREQNLSKHLLERIIRAHKPNDPMVEQLVLPATRFSGDIIATEFTPNNILHVILADSAGHGLSAALNVLPVVEVFYSMTEKGYSLPTIVRELNNKIKQLMPTERFVAATLAAIDFSERTIEIWNGGMPTAYFVDEKGKIIREWRAAQPPMGIMSNADFLSKTDVFQWSEPGRLFLYSDGLVEAENEAGERFGSERLLQALKAECDQGQFWFLIAAANQFMGLDSATDDISLAAIHCPMAPIGEDIAQPEQPSAKPVEPSESRLAVKLSPLELKSFDVLPWLINWLQQLNFSQRQCQEMFLILSELYNNSLDHGVLALNSSIKHQPDGFGLYLDMREERLVGLQQGSIEIELERVQENQVPCLKLRVTDSGMGFHADSILNVDISSSARLAGRGIVLVKSLCAEVSYPGSGNEVVALYRLK